MEHYYDETLETEAALENNKQIASANISCTQTFKDGVPTICLQATRRIEATEQLGFSYGMSYWTQRHTTPSFFNKRTGYPISSTHPQVDTSPATLSTAAIASTLFKPKPAKQPKQKANTEFSGFKKGFLQK